MSTKLFTMVSDANNPTTLKRILIMPAQVVEYETGLEQRNRIWQYPRFRFDAQWQFPLSQITANSVQNFWVEHGGDFETFLVQPTDFGPGTDISTGQVLGKGNGVRTLYKVYGNRFGSAQVYVNGSSVSATYSGGNGLITMGAAPASGAVVTADVTSERYVVRFATSEHEAEFFLYQLTRGFAVTLIQDKGLA